MTVAIHLRDSHATNANQTSTTIPSVRVHCPFACSSFLSVFLSVSLFLSGVSVLYQTGNLIIRRFGSAKLLRFFLSYTLLQTVTQTPRFFSSKIK